MRILIVDDDPTLREIIREYLEAKGHKCVDASTFEDAVDWVRHPTIEFAGAVVDGMFPYRDGVEPQAVGQMLCAYLRRLGIRTVILSGNHNIVSAELAGGHAALLKPAPLGTVLAALQAQEGTT